MTCPICGAKASGGHHVGDSTVIVCPHCGGYRLSGTVITEFENGRLKEPDPDKFKELVKRKRGKSTEYPVIMTYDLG